MEENPDAKNDKSFASKESVDVASMTIVATRSMSSRSSMTAVSPRQSIGETLLRARALLGSTSKNVSTSTSTSTS